MSTSTRRSAPAPAASYSRTIHPNSSLPRYVSLPAGEALLSPAITKRVIKQFARIPRPEPPRQLDELTERELEVFRLIARGLSNAEIARELYISDTTVKTHITHILMKLEPP